MPNELAVNQQKTSQVSMANNGRGLSFKPSSVSEVVNFANIMAQGGLSLPKHLRNNPGACMSVAMQAFEWNMNPFAVASKTYFVNDRLAFEAQLIAAVVNTRSGIKGRLKYNYEGKDNNLRCTVKGTIDGEEYAYTSPVISQISPKNSPMWKYDPQQQLGYYSARAWARRYVPEVILGVYDRDEVVDIAPHPQNTAPTQNPLEISTDDVELTTQEDDQQPSEPQAQAEHEQSPNADLFANGAISKSTADEEETPNGQREALSYLKENIITIIDDPLGDIDAMNQELEHLASNSKNICKTKQEATEVDRLVGYARRYTNGEIKRDAVLRVIEG